MTHRRTGDCFAGACEICNPPEQYRPDPVKRIEELEAQLARVQLALKTCQGNCTTHELNETKAEEQLAEQMDACLKAEAQLEALKEIAKQHLCDEMSDEQTVDMGDIEYGYDQLILIARAAIGEES